MTNYTRLSNKILNDMRSKGPIDNLLKSFEKLGKNKVNFMIVINALMEKISERNLVITDKYKILTDIMLEQYLGNPDNSIYENNLFRENNCVIKYLIMAYIRQFFCDNMQEILNYDNHHENVVKIICDILFEDTVNKKFIWYLFGKLIGYKVKNNIYSLDDTVANIKFILNQIVHQETERLQIIPIRTVKIISFCKTVFNDALLTTRMRESLLNSFPDYINKNKAFNEYVMRRQKLIPVINTIKELDVLKINRSIILTSRDFMKIFAIKNNGERLENDVLLFENNGGIQSYVFSVSNLIFDKNDIVMLMRMSLADFQKYIIESLTKTQYRDNIAFEIVHAILTESYNTSFLSNFVNQTIFDELINWYRQINPEKKCNINTIVSQYSKSDNRLLTGYLLKLYNLCLRNDILFEYVKNVATTHVINEELILACAASANIGISLWRCDLDNKLILLGQNHIKDKLPIHILFENSVQIRLLYDNSIELYNIDDKHVDFTLNKSNSSISIKYDHGHNNVVPHKTKKIEPAEKEIVSSKDEINNHSRTGNEIADQLLNRSTAPANESRVKNMIAHYEKENINNLSQETTFVRQPYGFSRRGIGLFDHLSNASTNSTSNEAEKSTEDAKRNFVSSKDEFNFN